MDAKFFPTPDAWRAWLAEHYANTKELIVGFHKKASGLPSMTWSESVDVALCFGWIDGVRRRIDDDNYSIRFTPRKSGSIWSAVNIRRVAELISQGLMHPAGLRAFETRQLERSALYSFEQAEVAFNAEQETLFRSNAAAWKFFNQKPAWYRKAATWWVVSAKRADTRNKRLSALMHASLDDSTVPHLTRK